MKKISTVLFLFAAWFLFANTATAQTGSLEGTVRTSEGELLPGATVQIISQSMGRSTNSRGYFQFGTLGAGSYTLSVSFIGFETAEVDIRVSSGETTTVSIELSASQLMLDDLLVTAQKRAQSIQEVPITISSLTGEFLTQTTFRNLIFFQPTFPAWKCRYRVSTIRDSWYAALPATAATPGSSRGCLYFRTVYPSVSRGVLLWSSMILSGSKF